MKEKDLEEDSTALIKDLQDTLGSYKAFYDYVNNLIDIDDENDLIETVIMVKDKSNPDKINLIGSFAEMLETGNKVMMEYMEGLDG